MNIFPAIDLKDNKCVRLTKGKDDTSEVFNENPIEQAKFFEDQGCTRLHLVDLDAAFGRNDMNTKIIEKIRNSISIPIQLGGGIRNNEIAYKYFEIGINFLIIGSYAVKNIAKVIALAESYKDQIYVALDLVGKTVMVNGWEKKSSFTSAKIFEHYDKTHTRGYVLTDIENDGMLSGLNINMIKTNLKLASKPLVVGGGLTSYDDLNNLKEIFSENLEGIIVGKSFYVGNIDLKKAEYILNNNA